MAEGTKIEWTDATWNPVTGCTLKSPGCTNCYAMKLAGTRLKNHPSRAGLTVMTNAGPVWNGEVRFNEEWLNQPLRWKRPRMIFVCAHGDLFAPGVLREWQDRVFDTMHDADHHVYQVLTKRPEDVAAYLRNFRPLPHIWLGCSVEDRVRADERREAMRQLAEMGWLTWVSYEPALGPIDWTGWEFLKWMVSGGESDTGGKISRPSHPDWHRGTRDWCAENHIAYLFKQWGSWAPTSAKPIRGQYTGGGLFLNYQGHKVRQGDWWDGNAEAVDRVGKKAAGRLLDGVEHNQFPESLT